MSAGSLLEGKLCNFGHGDQLIFHVRGKVTRRDCLKRLVAPITIGRLEICPSRPPFGRLSRRKIREMFSETGQQRFFKPAGFILVHLRKSKVEVLEAAAVECESNS